MNILVANDDGIKAEGIKALAEALSRVGKVYVVAPDSQRSGASHSITMYQDLYFKETEFEHAEKAYSFSGTPADCVKMGIALLESMGICIDMVFSGINHGGNLGTDTLYSGTVGAAREGLINNKMSVAVSVASHEPIGFEYAAMLAEKVALKYRETGRPEVVEYLWNINVPNIPVPEIKGLKPAKLGIRDYADWFKPDYREDGTIHIVYGGEPVYREDVRCRRPEIADVKAIEEGYATITPLNENTTCEKKLDELSKKERDNGDIFK